MFQVLDRLRLCRGIIPTWIQNMYVVPSAVDWDNLEERRAGH